MFPLLILLPMGDAADTGVDSVAHFGVIALVVCIPLVAIILRTNRPMKWVARTVYATLRRIPRCRPPADLADRIVAERDGVRDALTQHKLMTAVTSVGRALGDYLALYASLLAVGLRPSPAIVLVAFIAANAAGMVPFTPGGLGFVEAGLSGALVLTGAQEDQALAAVAIYRLVSCWLPVLAGVAVYVWSRRSAAMPPVNGRARLSSGRFRRRRRIERGRGEGAVDDVVGDVDESEVVVAGVVAQRGEGLFHRHLARSATIPWPAR